MYTEVGYFTSSIVTPTFCVLLTVHPGMVLVNDQIDAQFFMYVYFYSLHVFRQPCAHHQENYCINATPG